MGNASTFITLIVLIIICIFAAMLYKKKAKNGCCGCSSCTSCDCASKKGHESLVYIDGMKCSHCSSAVEKAFSEINCDACVDLEGKFARVYSSSPLDENQISQMVEDLGFTFVKIL